MLHEHDAVLGMGSSNRADLPLDRSTGALGLVTQHTGITTSDRRYVAEMPYGRDLIGGAAQLSVFGRANINAVASDQLPGVTGGMSFRLAF